MKSSLLVAAFAITTQLLAMDFEEQKPTPENKRQLLIPNQKISSEKFTEIIKTYTRLEELDASGHAMQHVPAPSASAQYLTVLKLNNGPLAESDTLITILTVCPQLQTCSVAHNQLTTLDEFKIPYHGHLATLDCSHNKISNVNFTQLSQKLHKLHQLNLSNCPLTIFETNEIKRRKPVPTIDLRNTQLDDNAKKSIVKNISCSPTAHSFGAVMFGALIGAAVGLFTPIIAFASASTENYNAFRAHSGEFAISMFGSSLGGMLAVGPACGYLIYLTCTTPKEREIAVFIPQFNEDPAYPEEAITTKHQRFVRHFPYAGHALEWCKTKLTKQKYTTLDDNEV